MIRFGGYLRGACAGLTARVIVLFVLLPLVQARAAEQPPETKDLIAPIVVDSSKSSPIYSPDVYVAGSMYRLIVTGTYSVADALVADAECSDSLTNPRGTPWTDETGNHHDLYDLEINGRNVEWTPLERDPGACADNHIYFVDISMAIGSQPGAGPVCDAASSDLTSTATADDRYCFEPGRLRLGINMRSGPLDQGNHDHNEGLLYVYPVCQFFNSAYIQQGAANSATSETAKPAAGCPNGTAFTNANYSCPNAYHDDKSDPFRRYGILTSAQLLIDSRTNELDPILHQDPHFDRELHKRAAPPYYSNTGTSSADEIYKFRQSGHWGITTCNLAGVGVPYRITVIGKYKFDQTQPPGYAEADAECATGYPRSTAMVTDHEKRDVTDTYRPSRRSVVTEASDDPVRTILDRISQTSIGVTRTLKALLPGEVMVPLAGETGAEVEKIERPDEYIPAYYNYFFQLLRSKRLAGPHETRSWTDDSLPATWDYSEYVYASHNSQAFVNEGEEFYEFDDNNGGDWRPKRFEFVVTQTGSSGEPTAEAVDAFDLRVNYAGAAERFVDWKPLKETSPGSGTYQKFDGGQCSPDHAYYLDIEWDDIQRWVLVPNAPIHFKIQDVVAYNEWDNCGNLSINISTISGPTDPFEVKPVHPDFDFAQNLACHRVPYNEASLIKIRDLRLDDRNAANLQTAHAYYFDPTSTVVSERRDHMFGEEAGRTNTANTVVWENFGAGPHSITAAVDQEGRFCHGVVTYPTQPLISNVTEITTTGTTTTKFANVGSDDCDRAVTRTSWDDDPQPSGKRVRLFDSHSLCFGDIEAIAPSLGLCTAPFERFEWNVNLTPAFKSSEFCENGFCSIPYFCRVAPEIMRGNLVVRLDSP